MSAKYYNIGKVVNTHGIRGEVKVLRITDFAERFNVGETIYLDDHQDDGQALIIDGHRLHKGFDLLHFKGLGNINDVEHLKGKYLKIAESQQTSLEEGEYYYHEIIGCEVYLRDKMEKIGVIKEVLSPGANDVWVVKRAAGKDILLPYIDDVIKAVDVAGKKSVY
ncbi:ribosome maturation factor RimM [Virgibacillus halophilus]|uniref:Ribosome maturation factor RimM n=1 Tax=Tigheibacillus halophilus TaxID=361280 RepID=A0ABU5CAS7_9BACI|nr:ribosome maturation factor RimM [Virgibacillus halophilus]